MNSSAVFRQLKLAEPLVVLLLLLVLPSCSKDDEPENGGIPCSTSWASGLQNEINAISTAVMMYGFDPSATNCNAVKSAYQDYLDGLQPYGSCSALTGQSRTDYEQAVQEAQNALSTWQC